MFIIMAFFAITGVYMLMYTLFAVTFVYLIPYVIIYTLATVIIGSIGIFIFNLFGKNIEYSGTNMVIASLVIVAVFFSWHFLPKKLSIDQQTVTSAKIVLHREDDVSDQQLVKDLLKDIENTKFNRLTFIDLLMRDKDDSYQAYFYDDAGKEKYAISVSYNGVVKVEKNGARENGSLLKGLLSPNIQYYYLRSKNEAGLYRDILNLQSSIEKEEIYRNNNDAIWECIDSVYYENGMLFVTIPRFNAEEWEVWVEGTMKNYDDPARRDRFNLPDERVSNHNDNGNSIIQMYLPSSELYTLYIHIKTDGAETKKWILDRLPEEMNMNN